VLERAARKNAKKTSEADDRRSLRRNRGSPDRLPNRLCAEFATARSVCAQTNQGRVQHRAELVAAAVPQSKNIPVYFQRVRRVFTGLVAASVMRFGGVSVKGKIEAMPPPVCDNIRHER